MNAYRRAVEAANNANKAFDFHNGTCAKRVDKFMVSELSVEEVTRVLKRDGFKVKRIKQTILEVNGRTILVIGRTQNRKQDYCLVATWQSHKADEVISCKEKNGRMIIDGTMEMNKVRMHRLEPGIKGWNYGLRSMDTMGDLVARLGR